MFVVRDATEGGEPGDQDQPELNDMPQKLRPFPMPTRLKVQLQKEKKKKNVLKWKKARYLESIDLAL